MKKWKREKVKKINDRNAKLNMELKAASTESKKRIKRNRIESLILILAEAEINVNIGTSIAIYIDPRVIVSWAKRHDMPIEAIYKTANDRTKFIWSMETPSSWTFSK